MVEKLIIDNQELIVMLTIEDEEYGKVKKCLSGNRKYYVIDEKIVTDEQIIEVLDSKYEVRIPVEWMDKN